ncbi:MAG: TRAP transporter small permease [Acidobacteriota bacterium]|nr:TRAP transporter small permease [Acidobacteriota bacterium]
MSPQPSEEDRPIPAHRRLRNGLTKGLEWFLVATMALLVVDVVWGVFTRYALGQQAKWSEELARFLLIWVTLLGAAVAFGTKAHLGVDYFVNRLHPAARRWTAVVAHGVVLFFALEVLLHGGARVVSEALVLEQTTPALGWKMGHVYLALPISGLFVALFTVENLIETLTGGSADPAGSAPASKAPAVEARPTTDPRAEE